MPLRVSSTCAHHQEVKITLQSLWYHHTYTCDDNRSCVKQFWPPGDEHMCSKHVEAWNKIIVKQKFCASSWLITEINIPRCTVRKKVKKKLIWLVMIWRNFYFKWRCILLLYIQNSGLQVTKQIRSKFYCLVYSKIVTVISHLLPVIAKLQLQSDRTTEIFVSFQKLLYSEYWWSCVSGRILADFFICVVIKCVKSWFCAAYKRHTN